MKVLSIRGGSNGARALPLLLNNTRIDAEIPPFYNAAHSAASRKAFYPKGDVDLKWLTQADRSRSSGSGAGLEVGWITGLLVSVLVASPGPVAAGLAVSWNPWRDGAAGPVNGRYQEATEQDAASAVAVADALARLGHKAGPLFADGAAALQRARLAGEAAPPVLRAVVVMCDFSDSLLYGRWGQVPGDFPPPTQSEFYYEAHDSLYFHHLLDDVRTYFTAVSDGQFTLEFEVIASVANLAEPMWYYGDHPVEGEQPFQLALDTVTLLDPLVNFSRYDTVVLIHAGAGEETDILDNSPEQIFSTYLSPEDFVQAQAESLLTTPYIPTQDFPEGEGIDQILILPETEYQDPVGGFGGYFGSLGVYCFEVGLRLGMLSLSDFTPPGRPDSQGIGEFGLMGFGLFVGAGFVPDHPCAFNKMLMGWLDPYRVQPEEEAFYPLTPAERASTPFAAARVEISGQEYWLLEYRQQDPDGNGIFSWVDDRNGDGVPNFTAIADPTFVPIPFQDFFDPDLHVRETLTGGEFDFFMSENTARPPGVKGAGSGIYIWHVDEGVVQEVFGAASNLFNADPARKSVDLEEADGIQDLDTRVGSPYILGGDDDSYRAEGNATFGPGTVPASDSAGGAWTGIVIDHISPVVADSTGGGTGSIAYADTMFFSCRRLPTPQSLPALAANRLLDGVDLRGSHLLAVDLDDPADGVLEIVAAGREGEVYAFEPDLSEHLDPDGDPAILVPLAVGTDASGTPVPWNGPPAAGDLDADGLPEIVVTAPGGLYAFNGEDGSEVAGDGDELSRGLLVALQACALPPVLLPTSDEAPYDPATPVVACVIDSTASGSLLRFIDAADISMPMDLALGAVSVPSPPLLVANTLWVPVTAGPEGPHQLLMVRWTPQTAVPEILQTLTLAAMPSAVSLAGGMVTAAGTAGQAHAFVIVPQQGSGGEVVRWDGESILAHTAWPAGTIVASSPAPATRGAGGVMTTKDVPAWATQTTGVAFNSGSRFAIASPAGIFQQGWPREPLPPVTAAAVELSPSPLRADRVVVFQSRDGRLFLFDDAGQLQAGWPLAGPSATAGTGLLVDLDGDGARELVANGTTLRIRGIDTTADELITQPVTSLAVWSPVGPITSDPEERLTGWAMWRGNPWRNSGPSPGKAVFAGGKYLVTGSHICYPNPLTTDRLRVRAEARQPGEASLQILNLEGEEVATAGPTTVPGGEPFEFEIPFTQYASGMYLCRLVFRCTCGGSETSVITFAATR